MQISCPAIQAGYVRKWLQVDEPGRRWFNWIYPLHTGEALRPWHHWVLLVIGLLPSLLFVTGVYMYLLRKGKIRRI